MEDSCQQSEAPQLPAMPVPVLFVVSRYALTGDTPVLEEEVVTAHTYEVTRSGALLLIEFIFDPIVGPRQKLARAFASWEEVEEQGPSMILAGTGLVH